MKKLTLIILLLVPFLASACSKGDTTSKSYEIPTTTSESTTNTTTSADSAATDSSITSETSMNVDPEILELTLEELAKYNGQDGNPAYVAIDGTIYDVTDSPKWSNGKHRSVKGVEAGNDLTEKIKSLSPHGTKILEDYPVVGKLVQK